jgi:hypothetical protein
MRPGLKKRSGNPFVHKRGDKWVITQKGTGKVLSEHDTEEKAQASFRAMEMNKHKGA